MRVTQSMYYKNLYAQNNSQLNSKLFDVNKQIASGLKIQYAHDEVLTFADTMRLDNEITTLHQIKRSTESGQKVSNQTDSILNDFSTSLDRTKTLIIQARNDTQSSTSRNAIAAELRGLERHFKNLANTSINGNFLFSGSAVNVKPIADDGTYMGNAQSMKSFLGSGVQQEYNLSGAELFLGEESLVKRKITTNLPQYSLSAKYPDFTDPDSDVNGADEIITVDNKIRDLMGSLEDEENGSSHFYIRGVKHGGEAFAEQISMKDSETVGELLEQIGNLFGNTSGAQLVNVSLDKSGSIVIKDKQNGSSKLDFHMVGAIDYDQSDGDAANINSVIYGATAGNIDHLAAGETDFDKIIKGRSLAGNPSLYVKNFIQSPFSVTPQTQDLISAKYAINPALANSDLNITIFDGINGSTPYSALWAGDASTTLTNLINDIEADGNFTGSIVGNGIVLNTTQQGISNKVRVEADLQTTGSESITTTIVNSSIATGSNAVIYDRTMFTKDGSFLKSTTPQVLKYTNAFANDATKISEVADISRGTATTADDGLAGTQLKLEGNNIYGLKYSAVINFKDASSGGSEFIVDTTGNGIPDQAYTIYDVASTPREGVDADDMTYRQLMDVVNMVATGNIPHASLTINASAVVAGDTLEFNFSDGKSPPNLTPISVAPQATQSDTLQAYVNAINVSGIQGLSAKLDGTDIIVTNISTTDYTVVNPTLPAVFADGGISVVSGITTIGSSISDDVDYDEAIVSSNLLANVNLSYDGKVTFKDLHNSQTKAEISMYDANSGKFSITGNNASVMTFNSNNALSVSDPKTDFFKSLDEIITAVEENKIHQNGTSGTLRNIGMDNALTMINDLSDHLYRSQSKVGSNTSTLSTSLERTNLLEVSTKVLRSSTVEIDLAEASLQLTQLSLNYEAMLSTVGKISKLSLVNYL